MVERCDGCAALEGRVMVLERELQLRSKYDERDSGDLDKLKGAQGEIWRAVEENRRAIDGARIKITGLVFIASVAGNGLMGYIIWTLQRGG